MKKPNLDNGYWLVLGILGAAAVASKVTGPSSSSFGGGFGGFNEGGDNFDDGYDYGFGSASRGSASRGSKSEYTKFTSKRMKALISQGYEPTDAMRLAAKQWRER